MYCKKKLTCHKTLTDVDEVAVSCLSCRTVADRRDLPKFSWCSVTLRALAFSVCTTSDILLALEIPTNVSEWTTNTYAAAGFNSVIWKQRIMMMTNDKFYCFFYLYKTIQTLFWITAYLQLIILLIFELLLLKMNMMAFALAKNPIVIDLLSRFSHHYKFSFLFTSRGCGFQPEGQRKRLIQHVYFHWNLKYPKIIKLIWFAHTITVVEEIPEAAVIQPLSPLMQKYETVYLVEGEEDGVQERVILSWVTFTAWGVPGGEREVFEDFPSEGGVGMLTSEITCKEWCLKKKNLFNKLFNSNTFI